MESFESFPPGPSQDLSRFQTFWQRFVASLLDGMILWPATFPTTFLIGYGPSAVAIAWIVVTSPVGWLYTSYCHGRWGQTIGKRVTNIKVVRAEDETPAGYARAFRRDIGTIVTSMFGCALLVSLVVKGDTESFEIFRSYSTRTTEQDPSQAFRQAFDGYNWTMLMVAAVAWTWSLAELGTMMLNDKRRALHDFIGGTVVVTTERI